MTVELSGFGRHDEKGVIARRPQADVAIHDKPR